MKKRILSALLVLCLACGLVSTAWATEGTGTVSEPAAAAETGNVVSVDPATPESGAEETELETQQDQTVEGTAAPVAAGTEYTAALESDGQTLNVIVTAPEGAFAERVTPVLHAETVTEETETAKAAEAVADQTGAEFDDMMVLDVYFTDGDDTEEIEPAQPVSVRFELPEAVLPEDIDPATLTVHHLAKEKDEAGNPVTDENGEQVVTVETVATATTTDEVEGVIALSAGAAEKTEAGETVARIEDLPELQAEVTAEAPAITAAPAEEPAVVAAFEVESFSQFTISWKYVFISGSWVVDSLTAQVVDTEGKPIGTGSSYDIWDMHNVNTSSQSISDLAERINGVENYTFWYARLGGYSKNFPEVTALKLYNRSDYQYGIKYQSKGKWKILNDQSTLYFVFEKNEGADNGLKLVDTVDNNQYGIEMYLFNYNTDRNDESAVTNSTGLDSSYTEGYGSVQDLLKPVLGDNGFPVVNNWQSISLQKWFDINSTDQDGIDSKQKVNHLFIQDVLDKTGYFYYSSADNFATIENSSPSENGEINFNVYKQLGSPASGKDSSTYFFQRGNFMPFNTLKPSEIISHNLYDLDGNPLNSNDARYNENIYGFNESSNDFHFGMYMTADFLQPRDGKVNDISTEDQNDTQDMVFEFTGDDDMWVYIDDILVLDLGGIHDALSGSINFNTGNVTWQAKTSNHNNETVTKTLKELFVEAVGQGKFNKEYASKFDSNTFADYSNHTLKMFYMERGKGASNLRIKFNIPPVPSNSLSVEKKVTSETEAGLYLLGDYEYKFQVVDEKGDLLVKEGDPYEIRTNGGQTSAGSDTVGANGIFTLKNGESAVFTVDKDKKAFEFLKDNSTQPYYVRELFEEGYAAQYGDTIYTITGQGGEAGAEKQEVEGFDGFRSSALTGNMGVGFVQFNNKIDASELSTLHLKKELMPGSHYTEGTKFDLFVTVNDEPLPVGTTYYLEGDDTPQSTTRPGVISLEPGQEIVLVEKLVVGSKYTVAESLGNENYKVSYAGEKKNNTSEAWTNYELTPTQDSEGNLLNVSGTITETGSSQRVTVTNSDYDFYASVPVTKELKGYTSGSYTFSFTVTEVEKTGNTYTDKDITSGVTLVGTDIAIYSAQNGEGNVYFGFDNTVANGIYYFKVKETEGNTAGVQYDENYYIVPVTVSKDGSGKRVATVGTIEKYGAASTAPVTTEMPIKFVNSLSSKLTVTKIVDGKMGDTSKQFKFTLSLALNGSKYDAASLQATKYTPNEEGEETEQTISVSKSEETGLYEFTLGHDERIELDVPYGYTAIVTENEDEGYTVYTKEDSDTGFDINNMKQETVTTDADHTIDFKNFRDPVAPTGLESNHTAPYTILVTVAGIAGLALIGGIVARRVRRRREE